MFGGRHPAAEEMSASTTTSALPGVQVLFAFLLVAAFNQRSVPSATSSGACPSRP
jgi:hypothetical protein